MRPGDASLAVTGPWVETFTLGNRLLLEPAQSPGDETWAAVRCGQNHGIGVIRTDPQRQQPESVRGNRKRQVHAPGSRGFRVLLFPTVFRVPRATATGRLSSTAQSQGASLLCHLTRSPELTCPPSCLQRKQRPYPGTQPLPGATHRADPSTAQCGQPLPLPRKAGNVTGSTVGHGASCLGYSA